MPEPLDHLEQRLFQPERLGAILFELIDRARNGESERKAKRKTLEKELRDTDAAIRRLYELVERGLADLDETLRNRLSELKQRREETLRLIAITERELSAPRAHAEAAGGLLCRRATQSPQRRDRLPQSLSAVVRDRDRG